MIPSQGIEEGSTPFTRSMHTTKLTKIVATVGPSTESEEIMAKLIDAGVNVFRFNTKHNTPQWHDEHIRKLQRVADQKHSTIGILLDLQGPEIRLETRDKKDIPVKSGQKLLVGFSFIEGIDLIIPHSQIFRLVKKGQDLLIDDGFVESHVLSVTDDQMVIEIENDSVIKHRKGVNLPGVDVDFPSLIENDIRQLEANSRNKVDFVGLSFVRSAHDVELLRAELIKREMKAQIIGKIESQPALNRLDEIIHTCDAIMVARGDLGVEVPFEQLAFWQKTIIDKCRLSHKPVITATQMLESMIQNPRPTRAEVTDIAHAVFDGTDAVMLSAESASGKYPLKSVQTMAKIAKWNEMNYHCLPLQIVDTDPTATIASAVVSIVESKLKPQIDALLVFTETGYTARAIAAHRLRVPLIAATDNRRTAESLTVCYGVSPVYISLPSGPFESVEIITKELLAENILHRGDTIVIVHGYRWQKPGNTNSLSIVTL